VSSPGSSVLRPHSSSRKSYSTQELKPFERRFSSKFSRELLLTRSSSPGFLSPRSRQPSISSHIASQIDDNTADHSPWEVVRWTKLKKITGQVFSEIGKRNFGRATTLCVAASIVIGTSKGLILIFDYQQTLKSIVGHGTKATECGAVTSIAISADHSTIASGHANGNIFTWEVATPAKPFLHIVPISREQLEHRQTDGHVHGTAILHIGFLGTRRTAIVSADASGMSFSHLATRGLGAVGRVVKTTRILGRYPSIDNYTGTTRKASSVLAFAPLPLGNVEQPTDGIGLTALLTPYLLVIVSTTPIAQTQHKAARPRELVPHSTLSGALAWFPAVKLKSVTPGDSTAISKTKLVYCWSNILTVLEIEANDTVERDRPPELEFKPRSRWKSEEAIVAVQWLSRSVLGVLTVTQRLIILEDESLRVTDSFDLLHKHILHQDLFSKQLQPVIEQLDENDASMHGVVADAFYMSFRAYKGRLFLLGFHDISIGTLSNWADRLLALMEEGDFIAALRLATSYYNGQGDKITVGLPSDDATRQAIMKEKLSEMVSASVLYIFSDRNDGLSGANKETQLKELCAICLAACLSMRNMDIFFEDIYESYKKNGAKDIFFETLEPAIMDEEILTMPPEVLKDFIIYYASSGQANQLEEIICRLDTTTMDIDLVVTLCRQFSLYDALIYIWTEAMKDYVNPFIELLDLVQALLDDENLSEHRIATMWNSAMKIFPYMAYTLTGRRYPSGEPMEDSEADVAKASLYDFILSGRLVERPKGSGNMPKIRPSQSQDTLFPYLKLLLAFDTSNFMSMLNEAFEDPFLNNDQDPTARREIVTLNGIGHRKALVPTRQYIMNILLEIMTSGEYEPDQLVYFYMFVARNLPKFPQHVMLPGSTLRTVLLGLTDVPSEDVRDDCQLSVEYLLSVYHPSDVEELIEVLEMAHFYRVLKHVYKSEKQYAKLLQTFFKDGTDQEAIFDAMRECFQSNFDISKKQILDVRRVIICHAEELSLLNADRFTSVLRQLAPDLLEASIASLQDKPQAQYRLLGAMLEPKSDGIVNPSVLDTASPALLERYIALMCRFDRTHVPSFIDLIPSGSLKLEEVLPFLEQSGIIDAAVVLMTREGLAQKAAKRLVNHFRMLDKALVSLIQAAATSPDINNTREAFEDLLDAVDKYCKVGIWLCRSQSKAYDNQNAVAEIQRRHEELTESDLYIHERLWLEFIDAIVSLSKDANAALNDKSHKSTVDEFMLGFVSAHLRSAIQEAFTALLASTTVNTRDRSKELVELQLKDSSSVSQASFLRILRCFLSREAQSSPTLSDLRHVLTSIFSAYTFESTILSLANRFLDKDAFVHVAEINELRQMGWRPKGQICEGCKKRCWGPGAGAHIWEKWEKREAVFAQKKRETRVLAGGGDDARRLARGKGREEQSSSRQHPTKSGNQSLKIELAAENGEKSSNGTADEIEEGPVIIFGCRHLWHKNCVEKAQANAANAEGSRDELPESGMFKCPLIH
jgi:vacuolar protein sorting-associated protein 8